MKNTGFIGMIRSTPSTASVYTNRSLHKRLGFMADINTIFKNRKANFERFIPFGFTGTGSGYIYSAGLYEGRFEMTVTVTKTGSISAEITDTATKDPYVLHRVAHAQGAFVGRVREEYERILTAIADTCFESNVFKSKQAGQIIRYVRKTYQDELHYLWKKFPENAVFRRQDNNKWYAALLTVQKQKLGLAGEGVIEIIDLRIKPEQLDALVDGKKYLPGYHMNKKHWFTICLDGSVSTREICKRINESYDLALK